MTIFLFEYRIIFFCIERGRGHCSAFIFSSQAHLSFR